MMNDVFGRNKSGSMENSTGGDLALNQLITQMNNHFSELGGVLKEISDASNRKIFKQWRSLNASDLVFDNSIMSIYVDNSQNANAITIKPDSALGVFIIPANTATWITPLGASLFSISGTIAAPVYALFTDEIIRS